MSDKRPIGWQVTSTYCRECAPDALRDSCAPMREGDDYGVSYACDACGENLLPCDHQWGEWKSWFQGGEWRFCERADCLETERRETGTP
jgi:hypothetical protein